MLVGTNGGSLAATELALRIVGVVPWYETEACPEFLVKYQRGVHSYTNSLAS